MNKTIKMIERLRYIFLLCIIAFGLIAIIGSSGSNEGENTTPTANIISPSNGSTYDEGDTITFSGNGSDEEDGALTGSSLVWTSSIDGQIGTGTSFTRNDLSVGTHAIILTATDSETAVGTDSIGITVNIITSAPSAPTNVTATVGNEQITISWNSVSGATSYNIYYSTSAGVTIGTGTKISNVTSPYTHTGLTNDTTYYYVVTAENSYGESDESSEVNATPSSTLSTYTNSLGMTFKLIQAGTFTMGSPVNELGRLDDETQHEVTLTQSFYMQSTEVTQSQWEAVMGSNPSNNIGCSDCPVDNVSWDDVQTFITELNTWGEGTYRLPTESEWEYAARAGTTTAFANGDITEADCGYDPNLDIIGWYCNNSSDTTHPVARKDPNAWGLYDMHGNVYEWCQDWYGTYPSSSVTDPTGPTSGSARVRRGGSWNLNARECRSASRLSFEHPDRDYSLGFRLLRNP